ncbi:MAG: hypothetical protein M1457_10945 [bacterium]|nr:hypothetical protein [bacterium]
MTYNQGFHFFPPAGAISRTQMRHARRNKQEAYKKNFRSRQAAVRRDNRQRLKVRVMFQYEARFGRVSDPRPCWASPVGAGSNRTRA